MRIVPGMYGVRADEDIITVTVVAELAEQWDDEGTWRNSPGPAPGTTSRAGHQRHTGAHALRALCVATDRGGGRRHLLELIGDEGSPETAPSALDLAAGPRLDRALEQVAAHTDALSRLLEELRAGEVLVRARSRPSKRPPPAPVDPAGAA